MKEQGAQLCLGCFSRVRSGEGIEDHEVSWSLESSKPTDEPSGHLVHIEMTPFGELDAGAAVLAPSRVRDPHHADLDDLRADSRDSSLDLQ